MSDKEFNELSMDELEQVAGGYTEYEPSMLSQTRFIFNEAETKIIQDKLGITLSVGRAYSRSELNELGIRGKTTQAIRNALDAIGLHKN